MKIVYGWMIILAFQSILVACATSQNSSDSSISEDISGEETEAANNSDLEESSDGQGTAQDSPDLQEVEVLDASEEKTAQVNSANEEVPTLTNQGSEPLGSAASGSAQVTGLDFKSNENGGTVVIQGSQKLSYTTRKNPATKQFIVEIANVELPKKFQRPYNTKEFSGPIGSINAYQKPGSQVARVVVQLRDNVGMAVQREGNSLLVMQSGSGEMSSETPQMELNGEVVETEVASDTYSRKPVDSTDGDNAKVLGKNSLDDFLSGNVRFYGKPISLQIKDADIRDIFNFIAEETGLNLVLSDEVRGKVTLKLRKIPWDQALHILMQSNQLAYVRQGNILRIAPLNTIKGEAEAAKAALEKQRELQSMRTKIFPISFADAAELAATLTPFLSSTRAKAFADKRTNALVVTDIQENIEKIADVIKRLDTPTPQVLIEAKIIETSETLDRSLGINWTSTRNGIALSFLPGAASSATADVNFSELGDLTARLGILETQAKVKILSAPRVITVNKRKASISQQLTIPTFTTSTTPTGGTSTAISYVDVPLSLDVTPQVANNGTVQMDVSISRKIAGAAVDGGSGARPIATRTASTTVMAQDGDTVVIGGIYQNDQSEAENGFPILRKIPILGHFFKGQTFSDARNELAIFITPTIVNKKTSLIGDT